MPDTQIEPLELTRDEAYYLHQAIHLGETIAVTYMKGAQLPEDVLDYHLEQTTKGIMKLGNSGMTNLGAKLNKYFGQFAGREGKLMTGIKDILASKQEH